MSAPCGSVGCRSPDPLVAGGKLALDPVVDYGIYTVVAMIGGAIRTHVGRRMASVLLILATLSVSVGTVYGAVQANVNEQLHACCQQDKAVTPCYTLCAASRSNQNLGATPNWQPPALVLLGTFVPEPSQAAVDPPTPVDRENPSVSPPIYILNAVCLI